MTARHGMAFRPETGVNMEPPVWRSGPPGVLGNPPPGGRCPADREAAAEHTRSPAWQNAMSQRAGSRITKGEGWSPLAHLQTACGRPGDRPRCACHELRRAPESAAVAHLPANPTSEAGHARL